MKNRYKIFLIAICVLVVPYASITGVALGVDEILNPASILYFPGVVTQLVANEGNGIICVDACGPCSSYGTFYVEVNGTCVLPEHPPQNSIVTLDKKTVRVEGTMADEICSIIGGECLPYYLGNIQDDGTIMVGFVISDQEKTKHYQFFIKDDILNYDVIENES